MCVFVGAIWLQFEPDPQTIGLQFFTASAHLRTLLQRIGAYGGFNPAGNGTWGELCPHCPYAAGGYSYPGFEPGYYGGGRFAFIVPPTFGDSFSNAANLPSTLIDPVFAACQLSKACIAIANYAGMES